VSYAEKVFSLSHGIAGIRDGRMRPRIATAVVVRSLLAMFLARIGSLHALSQTRPSRFWQSWLGAPLPSADTLGRVPETVDADALRQLLGWLYTRLKRNKALTPTAGGLTALVIDGHESHASYRRCCPGCCQRLVRTAQGEQVQFYHRWVTGMLLSGEQRLWLDCEPQRPGEDEVAAALRLLERVLDRLPRAFDVVIGDALYTDPRLYQLLHRRGKDALTVLKNEQRELLQDARRLFDQLPPLQLAAGCRAWDQDEFTTWPQVGRPVRVVCTEETRQVRRQRDGVKVTLRSQWAWVTTLSPARAGTAAVVRLGHARWEIENQGFNEMVTRWPADHVYRHHPTALLVFWLLAMLAFNLFFAFARRNLQPELRKGLTGLHLARCLATEIYSGLDLPASRAP
jgi:hypothetical protein